MQSPWQILQIDPSAASEKDVKVAYARLIKLHRPDTDPDGFRRVREAYEIGLAMTREGASQSSASAPLETTQNTHSSKEFAAPLSKPIVTKSTSAIPATLAEAESSVSRARAVGDAAITAKAVGSLFSTCRTLMPDSAGIRLWHESLHRVTGGSSNLVAAGVTVSQLIAELEAGSSVITHACVGHWEKVRDMESMLLLADAILSEPQRLSVHEAAIVALRLALETGFKSPSLSMRLTDFALPHLDREAQEQFLPQVERQAQIGAVFSGFRRDQLAYWHQRFRRPDTNWPWNDPEGEAAIEYLTSSQDRDWQGYALIKQLAPADWFARMEVSLDRKHSATAVPVSMNQSGNEQMSRSRSGLIWLNLIWAIPLLAFFAARQFMPSDAETDVVDSQSAGLPAISAPNSNSESAHPKGDFATGLSACQQRTAELLKMPSVEAWNQILRTMQKNASNSNTLVSDADQFRRDIQGLLQSISRSETDQTVEQNVLELLLIDPTVGELLKQEAIFRQTAKLPLPMFLPVWQSAAKATPEQASLIAVAAAWYIDQPSHSFSMSSSERQELTGLAQTLPKAKE